VQNLFINKSANKGVYMANNLFKNLKKSNSPQAQRIKEQCVDDTIKAGLKGGTCAEIAKESWLMGYTFAMECMTNTIEYFTK
jgi:hypothetical protein